MNTRDSKFEIQNLRCRTGGLTILELVLAVSMMAVVVAVMAPILHGVQGSWAAKEGNSESLAHARAFMHHFHQQLSQAVRVTAVSDATTSRGYIQFITCDDVEAQYAIDAADDIQFGPLDSLMDIAGPVNAMRFTCYDGNDFSTPTTDANSIRLIAVEATFRNSNSSGRDHTLSTSVYIRAGAEEAGAVVDPGVAMKQEVYWGGVEAMIDSYRSSEGAYDPAAAGSEAAVTSNAFGADEIVLTDGAILHGSAYIGPGGDPATGISVTGGAQITGTRGTLIEAVDIPNLSAPTGAPFIGQPSGDYILPGDSPLIDSNRYLDNMQLTGNSVLSVEGNVTILLNGQLEMSDDAQIWVMPGSSLRLYIKSTAVVGGGAGMNSLLQTPASLRIYMIGSNKTMTLEDSARVWAVVQNPKGAIAITGSAQFHGKMRGEQLDGGGKIHVDLDAAFE